MTTDDEPEIDATARRLIGDLGAGAGKATAARIRDATANRDAELIEYWRRVAARIREISAGRRRGS